MFCKPEVVLVFLLVRRGGGGGGKERGVREGVLQVSLVVFAFVWWCFWECLVFR